VLFAIIIEMFGLKAQSDFLNSNSIAVVIVSDSQLCRTGGLFADQLADRQPSSSAIC
jgi:hypothetical protein